jgi:hypothetical protein
MNGLANSANRALRSSHDAKLVDPQNRDSVYFDSAPRLELGKGSGRSRGLWNQSRVNANTVRVREGENQTFLFFATNHDPTW